VSVEMTDALKDRWSYLSANHTPGGQIGRISPSCRVSVRRGHLQRTRNDDGHWTAIWTPDEDYVDLPIVNDVTIDWTKSANGIKTATITFPNLFQQAKTGPGGVYHETQIGYYGPLRGYKVAKGPRNPQKKVSDWSGKLLEAAEVLIRHGYGDEQPRVFSGLIDTIGGASKDGTMSITARDWGQLLTDAHCWGWNVDPALPLVGHVTFVDRDRVVRYEKSRDKGYRATAKEWRKGCVLIDDVSDIVRTVLRWAGFPKRNLARIKNVGTSIKENFQIGPGDTHMDVIKKIVDATGWTFFIGLPSADYPMGRPTFRPATQDADTWTPAITIKDTDLLTGFEWTRSDESMPSIIRIRGKNLTVAKGGTSLSGSSSTILAVYRPPWHTNDRDGRIIKHVTHTEPLLTSYQECLVLAIQTALNGAIDSTSAEPELPGYPGLELDDVVSVQDQNTGVVSRVIVNGLQSSWTRQPRQYKQTLTVSLLDTPDVVQTLVHLNAATRKASRLHPNLTTALT
jgi:hypothetical protein